MSDAASDPLGGPADQDRQHTGADPADPAVPFFAPKPLLRLGYDRAAVDELVAKVVLAVHNERQTSVGADDVARARFPSRRWGRGYDMRDVDDYLGVAEALLRMRATAQGRRPAPVPLTKESAHHHPRTWWVYAIAAVLVLVIVGFTLGLT